MRPLWPRPWECTFQNSLQAPKQKWFMCVCGLQRLQQAQHYQPNNNRKTVIKMWIRGLVPTFRCSIFDTSLADECPSPRPPAVCRQKTCYQTTVKNHQLRVDRTYYSSNGNEDLFASSTQLMWFVPFQCLYTLRPECTTKATRIFDDDGDDDDDASLCLSVGLATVATCQNSFAGLFELRC